jgi:hypothetical protein
MAALEICDGISDELPESIEVLPLQSVCLLTVMARYERHKWAGERSLPRVGWLLLTGNSDWA